MLVNFIELLYASRQKNGYLIDEYDVPLDKAFPNGSL